MSFEILPRTAPGERLRAAIASIASALSDRAAKADQDNSLCRQNYADMQAAGITAAFVPESLGGMGVTSMHDWIAAMAQLARADGSSAIGMSMHFSTTRGMASRYASCDPDSTAGTALAQRLRDVVDGNMLICSTTTERGTDNLHPLTEAVRTEAGWEINGAKYFVTMSPIATHISMNVRAQVDGQDQIANIFLPMSTRGIHPQGDWNALGMRASGSQSIELAQCHAPLEALRVIGPWGQWSVATLLHRTLANVPLVSAFLGIAEAAYELAVQSISRQPERATRPGVQHTVAEMQIALATCQSMLSTMGQRADSFLASRAAPNMESSHELMMDYQSMKWICNNNAIDIVSKAMDLAGGGGYLAHSPLTRLYRDVRAGPFMQPHSRIDAREYIGQIALKLFPDN